MKKTFISIILLFLSIILISCGQSSDDIHSSNLELNNVHVEFRRDLDNMPANIYDLHYDEDWFIEDSYTYKKELAEMSIGLVLAGYDDSDNYDVTGKSGDKNIKNLFNDLGYSQDTYYSVGYNVEDNDNVGIAMSSKEIEDENKEKANLLTVCIRSGGYGNGGWKGNFTIGDGLLDSPFKDNTKYHLGFYNASSFAYEEVKNYMANKELSFANTKVWIVGFSRGAAIANITSILLGDSIDRKNIYTYAGATPNYVIDEINHDEFKNIFNIVNSGDIVPTIPPTYWNFGVYGTVIDLPFLTSNNRESFEADFKELAGSTYTGLNDYSGIINSFYGIFEKFIGTRLAFSQDISPIIFNMLEDSESEKMDFSILNSILSCEKTNKEAISVDDLLDFLSTQDMTNILAIAEVLSILDSTLNVALEYWQTRDSLYYKFIQKTKDLFSYILSLYMGEGSKDDLAMIDLAKEALSSGSTSQLIVQHWPELYLARIRSSF